MHIHHRLGEIEQRSLWPEALSSVAQYRILDSGNAMRGLLYPADALPDEADYLKCWSSACGLEGAILLEDESPGKVSIHPLIIPKDRHIFQIYTELAIIYCLLNQIVPTSKVLNTPQYSYMHKFLEEQVGCVRASSQSYNIYVLPEGWKPKLVTQYYVEV